MIEMTVLDSIHNKIRRSPRGTIFFIDSFPDVDEKYAANVLSSLVEDNVLIRLAQGIYAKPTPTRFGPLLPADQDIIKAIAKRDKAKILPSGETALNWLHYSTQMPMNLEFLTTGSARTIKLGERTIKLKKSAPKNFAYRGKLMPMIVLALRAIGQDDLTEEHIGITRRWLKEQPEEKTWKSDVNLAPTWIKKLIIKVKGEIENEQMDGECHEKIRCKL